MLALWQPCSLPALKAERALIAPHTIKTISEDKPILFILMLHWIALTEQQQIADIKTKSAITPQVVFKHSTRCNISSVALKRLENAGNLPNADYYYLDLIKYRHLSDAIAHTFDVYHESPQILVIKNSECVYDESHLGIDTYELTDQVVAVQ